MDPKDGDIRHVSDTALMVAACRALETARADGFVRDPFAERLAGERGMAIARALPRLPIMCFGVGARSRFLDELVARCVAERGVRTVVCLGCGLDTRPWRVELPADLRWIEVDFPDMLEYKAATLETAPKCRLERVPADLNDTSARRAVYERVGMEPALMITEGLLTYLPGELVRALASEPPTMCGVRYWLMDLASPAMAQAVGMDSFKQVQDVRAEDHLDGAGILDAVLSNGWTNIDRRSYITDTWSFASERIRAMYRFKHGTEPPPPPKTTDDPSGVNLFGRISG